MLTSGSNQYLRPDYLSPLPTTLDAKKSPLALLAQTCSNIGADTPSSKPLIPPVEKQANKNESSNNNNSCSSSEKREHHPHREKHSPHNHHHTPQEDSKSSFKPYENLVKKEDTNPEDKTGFRTPTSNKSSSSPSVSSVGLTPGKNTPTTSASESNNNKTTCESSSSSSSSSSSATTVTSSLPSSLSSTSLHSQHNRISIGCGNMFVEVNHHESALPSSKETAAAATASHLQPLAAYKGQLLPPTGMLNSLSNCSGCTQVVGHLDAGNAPSYKGYPATSSLSPYVAYARVKTAAGGTTLVPICRDPYCTNCQLSVQSAQLVGTCPSGCTQCTHEKAAAAGLASSLPGAGAHPLSALSLVPGLGGGATGPSAAAAAQLYSHFSHRPYVCNWIAGDTYCGKRFSTSEELLQHLRTHTNLSASDSTALPLLNPSAQSLACHLHYSTAPSLTTMAGLHRTYPTSLSPVGSSLSSSRYHPYKSHLPPYPASPLAPLAPHPGLGPYYSPYAAMYGPQRLGAAVHP